MNKRILTFCFSFCICLAANAQYDFGVTDLSVVSAANASVVAANGDIVIGDTLDIAVSMTNFGGDVLQGTTIYFVYDIGAGNELETWVVDSANAPISMGQSAEINLVEDVLTSGFTAGSIEFCFATDMADGDPSNDQSCQSFNMIAGSTDIEENAVVEEFYYSKNLLNYKLTGSMGAELTVYDLKGRLVDRADLAPNSSQYPLEGLKNGLYLVQLLTNEGTYFQKIMK